MVLSAHASRDKNHYRVFIKDEITDMRQFNPTEYRRALYFTKGGQFHF